MAKSSRRRLAVVCAVAAAILVPAVRAWLDIGLDQAEFASQGDSTLRASGYAFSIWGLIYLGLAAYAAFQFRARDTALIRAFGWPSVIAIGGCAAWIVASALNLRLASVAIILISAAAAIAPLLRRPTAAGTGERLLVLWPNAALAGWLTIASALAVITAATAEGLIAAGDARAWALGGVMAVLTVGMLVAIQARSAIYLVPIAWGLGGVYVAEKIDQPMTATLAAVGAAGLLLAAVAIAIRYRRR
jgi:hypothetical protein